MSINKSLKSSLGEAKIIEGATRDKKMSDKEQEIKDN
jgi:hypothetical protein